MTRIRTRSATAARTKTITIGSMLCVLGLGAAEVSAAPPEHGSDAAAIPFAIAAAAPAPADAGPLVLAMSSHGAASTDPARSKAEIEAWHYNSDYLFGLSRGTANSALLPAFKPFVFLVTVPLDLALLPIAAIGGLFG